MAKPTPTTPDQATSWIEDPLTADSGEGSLSEALAFNLGGINVEVWGTFTGTVVIESSFDGGANFRPVRTDLAGTALQFTAAGGCLIDEVERGVVYRARCTAYTSGTINVRISQG